MFSIRFFRNISSVFMLCSAVLSFCGESFAAEESSLPSVAESYGYLSQADVNNYHKIFELQKKERWQDADKVIAKLDNNVLMGYVLYQRYVESATWKTKEAESKNWLNRYYDLPVAGSVYDLAVKKGAKLSMPRPHNTDNIPAGSCSSYVLINPIDYLYNNDFSYLPSNKQKAAKKLMRNINSAINKGKTLSAYNYVNSPEAKQLFSKSNMIKARTALAFLYFTELRDDKALDTLLPILPDAYEVLPISGWVAGLVYWRLGLFNDSLKAFTAVANNSKTRPELLSAAAFWAAKVNFKLGKDAAAEDWLKKAASLERYFYGLLARRQLGEEISHSWQRPSVNEADESYILNKPAVRRAIALFQLRENKKAEDELLKYYYSADSKEKSGLLDFAEKNGMSELSQAMLSFGRQLENKDGSSKRASYPAPKWTPLSGWKTEKALVYAFVRQESCFNNKAVSSAGARGLMQLMPATAQETANRLELEWSSKRLFEPAYNLEIGQAYLSRLLNDNFIGGNLIFLAVAYNSGPGNLQRWAKRMDWQGDPLLFIESIPSKQTRSFVQRILGNYWIYSSLFGTDGIYTLDQLIGGFWPMLNY